MKHLLRSLTFIGKVILLVLLLAIGWAYLNISNLIKGKKTYDQNGGTTDLFGISDAQADTPSSACPHVAYFDGDAFKIENDFLPGDFKHPLYASALIRSLALDPHRTPDLLRFTQIPGRQNGAITLRFEELEPEESFVNRVRLLRAIHASDEEIIIDADTHAPFVVNRTAVERDLLLPSRAIWNERVDITERFRTTEHLWHDIPEAHDAPIPRDDVLDFVFDGLSSASATLIIRAVHRDWVAGEASPSWLATFGSLAPAHALRRAATLAAGAFMFWHQDASVSSALLPIIFGVQAPGEKSIHFSYKDRDGAFRPVSVLKPRNIRHSTEQVRLPAHAVHPDGTLTVRAAFTRRHRLSFIGAIQGMAARSPRLEILKPIRAHHSRLGDVRAAIVKEGGARVHFIPGDVAEAAFEDPTSSLEAGERETYLFQSSGYYMPLRPKYKKIAGDWSSRLLPEAREWMNTFMTR